jgi:hypothetical protein
MSLLLLTAQTIAPAPIDSVVKAARTTGNRTPRIKGRSERTDDRKILNMAAPERLRTSTERRHTERSTSGK